MTNAIVSSAPVGGTEVPPPPTPARRPPWTAAWNVAAVVGPVVTLLGLAWQQRWLTDDGLIFTRTVRQILAGNGPVVNVGERAEASTSTLWQWLLVLAGWLTGLDTAHVAVFGGLALAGGAVALALDGARRLYRVHVPGYPLILPAGVLVWLALPPVWDFATSGLETGLAFCWIALCWWQLTRTRVDTRPAMLYATAVLYGLGPLVRPDLAIASLVFAAALYVLVRPGWPRTLGLVAAAGAVPVAYEVFRMGYYGVLFPLPAMTKEAGEALWAQGLGYLGDFVGPYRIWVPLVVLTLAVGYLAGRQSGRGVDRRLLIVAGTPVMCGLLMATYVVRVGGDFMHGRMFLPALFLVLLPISALPLARGVVPAVVVVAVWALVCASTFRVPYLGWVSPAGIADERGYYVWVLGQPHPIDGEAYRPLRPGLQGRVDAATAIGARVLVVDTGGAGPANERPDYDVPLAAHVPGRVAVQTRVLGTGGVVAPLDGQAIDPLGLAYPLAAHVALTERGRPGHEKELLYVWIIADYADPAAPLPPNFDPDQVRAARHALSCGELGELTRSVRDPMTWDRFWKNLTGAVRRTSFRFPADPHEAERTFCRS